MTTATNTVKTGKAKKNLPKGAESTSSVDSDADTAGAADDELTPVAQLSEMLKQPLMIRFSEPGHARYSMLFDGPVESISWSVQAGITVSVGNELYNVTTKGQKRWKLNAGKDHHVFIADDEEVVWAKAFGTIFQMMRNGRVGWKREWSHDLAFNPPNTVYLVDASNVSRLAGNGTERWRVTVDGVRKMEGPFPCGELVLFQGKRGQKSVATVVSDKGSVVNEIELAFGSVVLGASFNCEPIVWSGGQVALVDSRGDVGWSYPLKNRPLLYKLFSTYLLIVPDAQDQVSVMRLGKDGQLQFKRSLPISGRVTAAKVIELNGLRQAIALCKDVSSPCARRDGNRGPYNVLLTGENGNFSVLERRVKGHDNLEAFFDRGFVHAGSGKDDETVVTMRDTQGKILWDVVLPGRLSAGPFVGPYGGVYVGTCMGWECAKPYRFISLTGAADIREDEEEQEQP
ncbi:MAG: hypothetical protein JXR45_02690 [Deltaproteobacteria bacterium]|nr:hypothetical protein [Deltaproteobacteria bacterium]